MKIRSQSFWPRRPVVVDDVEPLIAVDERHVDLASLFQPLRRPTFTEAEVDDIVTTWRIRAKRLGRDYGRASATIHALRAENALLREDRAALVDQMPDPWSEPTDVVGGGDAVNLGAAPKAGAPAPDDHLLADHIMAAVEQLARDLAKVDMPDVEWGYDDARFKDRYRALGWAVAAVGWRPPSVALPPSVETVARVLTDHDLVDDVCRCGWGEYGARNWDADVPKPALYHADHVAEQVVMLGVLG